MISYAGSLRICLRVIVGFHEEEASILTEDDLIRVYAEGGKVLPSQHKGSTRFGCVSMNWKIGWIKKRFVADFQFGDHQPRQGQGV